MGSLVIETLFLCQSLVRFTHTPNILHLPNLNKDNIADAVSLELPYMNWLARSSYIEYHQSIKLKSSIKDVIDCEDLPAIVPKLS